MATLTLQAAMRIILGGQTEGFEQFRQELACTEILASIVGMLTGGAPGTTETLWVSAAHGVQTNPLPQQFAAGAIIIDPEAAGASALGIDVEIARTRNNATTVTLDTRRITRNTPLILGQSLMGLDFTNIGTTVTPGTAFDHVTRIRARNPAASGDVGVRLLLLG